MARYPSSSYSRRRGRRRRWMYIISGVLIIAAVIVFVYGHPRLNRGPFGEDKTSAVLTDASVETGPYSAMAVEPESAPEAMADFVGDVPGLAFEPDPRAAEFIAEAMALVNARPAKIIEARDRLNEVLAMSMSRPQRALVKEQLCELTDKWLFSRTIFPQDRLCGSYMVKPGDQLRAIGGQFNVPYQILMEINNIHRPETLKAGETIKVINGPFHARVYRSTFTMDLYLQNTFIKSFPVGLGQAGMKTPTGLWRVKPGGKLISPTWTDPVSGKTYQAGDPDYPLGSRWIGLEGISGQAEGRTGFAIHGTKAPHQIGTADSQGCIRLHNGDAILLYNLLVPGLSQVEVVE